MDTYLYSQMLKELKVSAENFLNNGNELSDEVDEDISSIINVVDISEWEQNIDGVMKGLPDLLRDLEKANKNKNRQQCIGNIAMLRCAITDIESAFSNATDSLEKLIIAIRDNKK